MSDSSAYRRPRLVRWTLWLVVVHTGAAGLHAAAHLAIPVPVASPLDGALILGAFYLGPLAGALLLNAGRGTGAPLLAGSFLVGLAYGALSHFALPGPDNIASVPGVGWGPVFMITAAALSLLEGIGLTLSAALFRRPVRPQPLAGAPA